MGRIHNLNRKVGRMGLLNLLYLTSMPTEHKNKYFVKCRYGKYFLCVSKGYKNDLPRSLRSTPFKSPDSIDRITNSIEVECHSFDGLNVFPEVWSLDSTEAGFEIGDYKLVK